MTRRPLRWLLLGGAIVAALLLGVALRVRHTTPVDAVPSAAMRADAGVEEAPAAGAVPGLPPADGAGIDPGAAESPFDEPNAWASVDLDAVRRAMPDNLYWTMSSPTKDEDVLRARAEERARWNEEYGKVLSNTATEQEIDAYYAHRDRLASDYIQFATYVLENHGTQLPISDLGLLKVAVELNLAELEEIPRRIEEAQRRRVAHQQAREAWLRDQAEFGGRDSGAPGN